MKIKNKLKKKKDKLGDKAKLFDDEDDDQNYYEGGDFVMDESSGHNGTAQTMDDSVSFSGCIFAKVNNFLLNIN